MTDIGFTVTTASLPGGLQDGIAALVGERPRIPFRTDPAVPRGEASLTRTAPVIGAVAHFVLSAALDSALDERLRPARRCGVVRSSAVPSAPRCCWSGTGSRWCCPAATATNR